jgi:hypothetical protein
MRSDGGLKPAKNVAENVVRYVMAHAILSFSLRRCTLLGTEFLCNNYFINCYVQFHILFHYIVH